MLVLTYITIFSDYMIVLLFSISMAIRAYCEMLLQNIINLLNLLVSILNEFSALLLYTEKC